MSIQPSRLFQRALQCLFALACAGAAAQAPSGASGYPNAPVKFVVGFAAGGSTDIMARFLADKLTAALGQPFVVENRLGAGGVIAAQAVSRARPDGYTFLVATLSNVIISKALNPAVVPYDPVTDFTPVVITGYVPLLLTVNSSSNLRTTRDVIAYAQANPGKMNFSHGGIGTSVHIAAALFGELTNSKIQLVPYNGDTPAVVALLARDVDAMFSSLPSVSARFRSGELRPLMVLSPQRLANLPDVPTSSETGIANHEILTWHGILAPPNTPREIVTKVHAEVRRILATPEAQKQIDTLGFAPATGSPDDFAATIRADMQKWPTLVKISGAAVK